MVAPILKERLRRAGIKDPKVHAAPPPLREAKTPGSLVPSQVHVDVQGVSDEAKDLVVQLITQVGRLGVHCVDEPNPRLDDAFHDDPALTNAHVERTKGLKGHSRPTVEITLTLAGTNVLWKLTRENVGKRLGITVDDMVIVESVIQTPIESGTLELTFGRQGDLEDPDRTARLWALLLGLEPLPAQPTWLEER
jgi:preprotein translocase subunit SecD